MTEDIIQKSDNLLDADFYKFVEVLQRNFDAAAKKHQTFYKVNTRRKPSKLWNIWWLYLDLPPVPAGVKLINDLDLTKEDHKAFSEALAKRDSYNCASCKKFFDDYADLVMVNPNGTILPVFWHNAEGVPEYFKDAFRRCAEYFQPDMLVSSVFLPKSHQAILGEPSTKEHMHINISLKEYKGEYITCQKHENGRWARSYTKQYNKIRTTIFRGMRYDYDLMGIVDWNAKLAVVDCSSLSKDQKFNLAFKAVNENAQSLQFPGSRGEITYYKKI